MQKRNSSKYLRLDSPRVCTTSTTGLDMLNNPDLAALDRKK